MKLLLFTLLSTVSIMVSVPRIGDIAPSFNASTTQGKINFPGDYKGKWTILFSHPADFTPVCTTEFKRLSSMIPEFKSINTELIGLSVDSKDVHDMWLQSMESAGARRITFPVIADLDKKVADAYGMIHPNESKTQTVRSVYFIDPKGKIRAVFHYPLATGRSFEEIMRLTKALQIADKDDVLTPADWEPGKPTLDKPETVNAAK